MISDEFNPHIVHVGYQRWLPEDIGVLPTGKLPRKLKKRLKKELDNPDRKRVYEGHFRTVEQVTAFNYELD